MNIQDLQKAGAFVSTEPQKHAVEWKDHKFDVHVKALSFGDVERLTAANGSTCSLLAASILLGEDKQPLTLEQAERLDVSLAAALLNAVNAVNGGNEKN